MPNPYEAKSWAPMPEYADPLGNPAPPPKVVEPPVNPTEVPDGAIREVLEWVGTSPAKAQAALGVEQDKGSPRKTLVSYLESVL